MRENFEHRIALNGKYMPNNTTSLDPLKNKNKSIKSMKKRRNNEKPGGSQQEYLWGLVRGLVCHASTQHKLHRRKGVERKRGAMKKGARFLFERHLIRGQKVGEREIHFLTLGKGKLKHTIGP